MITEYNRNCLICGKPRTDMHHCIPGNANRRLSDEDELVIPLCKEHHEGDMSVHKNKEMYVLSHIIGQLAFEKTQVSKGRTEQQAREDYRIRYGKSYL